MNHYIALPWDFGFWRKDQFAQVIRDPKQDDVIVLVDIRGESCRLPRPEGYATTAAEEAARIMEALNGTDPAA